MADYTELCGALRNDAVQMEQHAITFCLAKVIADCRSAADAIEALQAENERLKAEKNKWVERHNEAAVNWQEAARWVAQLEVENERLKKELDAAVRDIYSGNAGDCDTCLHGADYNADCEMMNGCTYKWRGVED